MIETLKAFLHVNTIAESIVFYGALIIMGLLAAIGVIYAFLYICGWCIEIEEETKKESHPFIKSGMIAIAPTIFFAINSLAESLIYENLVLTNCLILLFAVMFVIVLIWNLKIYGIKGILFTISHTGYGLISAAIIVFLFQIAILATIWCVISFFLGGDAPAGAGSSSSSSSIPSYIREPGTNKSYYTTTGANNQKYVVKDGEYIHVRNSDFSGTFIDDKGKHYVK